MPDAAPMPPEESTPSAPAGLSGQTLPSGLFVVSRLYDSPEGRLYAGILPSGREVTLLVLSSEGHMPSQDGPELRARVLQRAREERLDKVKAIHHPNIAEIYGTDVAPDGTPCIVMEPFSGEPLSAILAARGAVPLYAAMDLSLQAAAGLTAAHAAGVVHGNMSPETMLLTLTADGHRLKLIGFGLGLFLGGSRNGLQENARYASPEQRSGVAADEQSDVFSLAAVLHHLVSGTPPGAGGVVAESIPRRLKAVLAKALADSRSDRFPTVAALATALEGASEPDDGQVERRAGRNRLVGVAAAIAVVAGVWLLWGSRQAGMRAEAAEAEARRAVPPESVVFGPVESGVSHAEAPKPITKTETIASAKTEPANAETEQAEMSPFRRSHPWAAYPQGRFYYPSSCSETLEFDDLVYFATEKEARAAGFLPSRGSRCP
jgi:serine/threonine protein kinase